MKKLFILAISFLSYATTIAQDDPVVMTIDNKKITKSEFLQIYLKNNPDPKYDKASLDEYMELFRKFKLKVAEAEALGYDTIPKLVRELDGYRKQLALPYLVDSSMNQELVKEAYDRTKNEIRASHIMIKLEPNALPSDTLKAWNRILEIKKRIENGENFEKVAQGRNGSEDPSVHDNAGDLGFFTAFQMVYPFEDAAYNTPVGQLSEPIRTRYGYHLIKVTDKRPARGTIETAHLMIAPSSKDNKDSWSDAETKINEIYLLLMNGENFEDLVSKYSDDPTTNNKKGILPPFGSGTSTRMIAEFEDAAFSLKNDGDFSKPVKTPYGYHIIKRIGWHDLASFDKMKKELEGKVAKDIRSQKTQTSFVAKKKVEYGYKDKHTKGMKWFYNNIDSTFYIGAFRDSTLSSDKVMFTLGKQKFTQKQYATFLVKNYRNVKKGNIKDALDELYTAWEKEAILGYEESHLSEKYPAFKALMTEYHDGILLYEIMSDKVWNKAISDTTGLKNYFTENKAKYYWGKRINAEIYEFNDKKFADQAIQLLKTDTLSSSHIVSTINEKSELNVKFRQGKYDINTTSFLTDQENFQVGLNDIYMHEGKYYLVKVLEILEPSQKEFHEAKGAITSDYQNYLEQKWIDELMKNHKIFINYDILYAIGQ